MAANTLAAVADSQLANFPIAPGRQTQVLRVRDNLATPEHFYIHVSGTQNDASPSFDAGGLGVAEPMSARPRVLTPFLTPLYDEDTDWQTFSAWNQAQKAFDAAVIDTEPLKPVPAYVWHYRPEYQFSQYSLEMQRILREHTDQNDQQHQQELLTGQILNGQIPTIRSDDDLITVFYSLVQQQIPRLTAIDGGQDLILALGAEELKIAVTEDGQISFENLAQIDRLDPTDLLTMRLYLNQDAGNTLWEWAFTRNGLHVYYQVPGNTEQREGGTQDDIEILSLLEAGDPGLGVVTQDPVVRTVGGMRLRYRYIPPSLPGVEMTKITWRFDHKGRYCRRYGVTPDLQCVIVDAGVDHVQINGIVTPPLVQSSDWSVYWEPLDSNDQVAWSNWAGTDTADAGVKAYMKAEYSLPVMDFDPVDPLATRAQRTYETEFAVKTRELKPDANNPMEGSDVAMLEAMLWNFGMSPSANPGIKGVRLDAQQRHVFKDVTPSVGAMMGRFNYISYWPVTKETNEMHTGQVDNQDPIAELGRHWYHYMQAYKHWQGQASIRYADLEPDSNGNTSAEAGNAIEAAEAVWDGNVNYPGGVSFPNIPETYTAGRHTNVETLTGKAFKRHQILKAMAQIEASGNHQTDHRIVVGGADERGSKSFNQLLNTFNYGGKAHDAIGPEAKTAALEVSAYTANGTSSVNHYDARYNLIAKAVWLAIDETRPSNGGGGGGFYRAFAATGSKSYKGSYGLLPATPLLKIETDTISNDITAGATHHQDDDYERLAKGLGAYNQGVGVFSGGADNSWLDMLLNRDTPKSKAFTGIKAKSYGKRSDAERIQFSNTEAMRYALSVMHDMNKLGLPYRTYVWAGEVEPDEIEQVDATGNPVTDSNGDPVMMPNPDAGEPVWCFAYGEKEWMDGKVFNKVKAAADSKDKFGRSQTPVGRVVCP